MRNFRRLIHEIHRRSLWQVLAVYLASSFAALQVVREIAEAVALPEWVSGAALVLVVVGLPIVLATAFVQEGVGTRSAGDRSRMDGSARGGAAAGAVAGDEAGAADADLATSSERTTHQRLFTWRNSFIGGAGAFALWGVVAAAWLLVGGGTSDRAAIAAAVTSEPLRSVAVLPFVTRSERPDDIYFAEGMHDDLLTQLSKIDSLTVISRTSVMQYANTQERIPVIARALGVTTILEGGVQRSGSRIRVNVQLIEAATDRHLWAETYDEELSAANVFAIQSDLARKIAQALRATLTPAVARRIDARPTESLVAYDLYIQARYAYQLRGQYGEDLSDIIRTYEQALAADPNFAPAWAGLGHAYLAAVNWVRLPREQAMGSARNAIARALTADPDLAEAHTGRARLLSFEGETQQAEVELLRAITLNPGMSEAYVFYARLLEGMGRTAEALTAARRAVELDPLSLPNRNGLADRLYFSGELEASIVESKKALSMSETNWYAWYNAGWSHAALGQVEDAVHAFHQALRYADDNAAETRLGLAYAFARGAQRDSALSYIAGVDPGVGGYDMAIIHFTLRDHDRALSLLEAALKVDASLVERMRRDPAAAAMVADPRFADLIRRFGLE